jgi:hypothetical protein
MGDFDCEMAWLETVIDVVVLHVIVHHSVDPTTTMKMWNNHRGRCGGHLEDDDDDYYDVNLEEHSDGVKVVPVDLLKDHVDGRRHLVMDDNGVELILMKSRNLDGVNASSCW